MATRGPAELPGLVCELGPESHRLLPTGGSAWCLGPQCLFSGVATALPPGTVTRVHAQACLWGSEAGLLSTLRQAAGSSRRDPGLPLSPRC